MAKILGKHTPANPKNWAMNGNFDINQRFASTQLTVTATRAYGLDRWALVPSVAAANSAQMIRSTVVTPPEGSKYVMNFGPWNQNNKCAAIQPIKHLNTVQLRGKTMTLSGLFYGDVGYRLEVIAWTGSADAITTMSNTVPYSNWGSYTLATNFVTCGSQNFTGTASTWNRYSLTVNIPTSANNILLALVKTADNGVQNYASQVTFNEGTVPMKFQLSVDGDVEAELGVCQAYFEKSYDTETIPGTTTNNGSVFWRAATANEAVPVRYKVEKIKAPIVTTYNPGVAFTTGSWRDTSAGANRTTTVGASGTSAFFVDVSTSVIGNQNSGHYISDAELG